MHLLSGNYLFADQNTQPTGYFLALTILFGVLAIVSIVAYSRRGRLVSNNPPLRRILRQASTIGIWSAGIGLFLALMRYTEFPFLSKPIFLLLLFFGMIFAVGYFVYELSERYPVAMYRLQQASFERRFKPAARPRAVPQKPRPNPKVRGKRRK